MTPAMHALLSLIREDCRPVCRDGLDLVEEYIVSLERKCEVLTLLASGDTPDAVSPPTPEKAVAQSVADERTEANNNIPIGHSVKVPAYAWRVDGGAA